MLPEGPKMVAGDFVHCNSDSDVATCGTKTPSPNDINLIYWLSEIGRRV
jgi:hypothetical protein